MRFARVLGFMVVISSVLILPRAAGAAFINYASKEVNVKIVYYGPPSAALMENLDHVYKRTKPRFKGKMISLQTDTDRVVFFDFIPPAPKIRGFRLRVHLYTVPGRVTYEASRKLILKGVDAVDFVADANRRAAEATPKMAG